MKLEESWRIRILWAALICTLWLPLLGCNRTSAQEPQPEIAKVEVPLRDLVREAPESVEFNVPEPSEAAAPEKASPTDASLAGEPEPGKPADETVAKSGLPLEANKPVAQAEEVAQAKEDTELPKRDYSELLKNPQELGFSPSQNLFRNVYYHIKQSFVEEVPEQALFDGVKAEVRNLLEQAKVPTESLDTLSPGRRVLPQLIEMYGDKVDRDLLVFSAILGMLDGLDDNYSLLMTPGDYSKLQEQMQSRNFGGIGIYIELDRDNGNRLTVFEPIEGTPAYDAGLLAGDKIVAIDGQDTDGITLDKAQAAIRGEKGTDVILTVQRKGEPRKMDFTITRGSIHVVSVSSKMLDGQIGYIRLRMFGSQTSTELADAIQKLTSQGAKGLVLDLRNNGGGYIDASVHVVGQFLEKRDGLVVYTIDRNKRRRDYKAQNTGKIHIPMVCMINKFSASASEITAGALRDHGVAKLVGEHSFGKGSVQQLYPFPDGTALKLTIAKFFTPSGFAINKKGLEPDFPVEMEPRYVGRGEKDVQLKRAIEILSKSGGVPTVSDF